MDKIVEEYEAEYLEVADLMKTCSQLKFRDLIGETVSEYSRMENFCRIYPARNAKIYDKFLSGHKALGKIIYKVLYTSEIMTYERAIEKSAHPLPGKAQNLTV